MDVDTRDERFDTRQYTNKATDFELPDYWTKERYSMGEKLADLRHVELGI